MTVLSRRSDSIAVLAVFTAAMNVLAADFTLGHPVWGGVRFILANTTNQAVLGVLTTNAASRLTIQNCKFEGVITAGTSTAIRIVGTDNTTIKNNDIYGAYTTTLGGIENVTTLATNLLIDGNTIRNRTALSTIAITLVSTTTGMVTRNRMSILSGTAPIVGAACTSGGDNAYSNAVAFASTQTSV